MQTNVIACTPGRNESQQKELLHKLRTLVERIQALQVLVHAEDEEDGDGEAGERSAGEIILDGELLRQGLSELEQMASEILYEVQDAGDGWLLAEVPGGSLSEALSQLVDTTAEKLALSSRVAFSGWERPLTDYLARLLYRIAQEALARVQTHEGARRLRFTLEYRRGEIAMTIEDDGVPGPVEHLLSGTAAPPPFLVTQEQEREQPADQIMQRLRRIVEKLGGSLVVNSGVEQGVQVQVRVPWRHHEYRNPHEHSDTSAVPTANQERVDASAKIRVLIVDGQTVSRAGLRRLLESYTDLEVVGEAGDSVQAVSETAELLPQIVLLDAQLPENQSVETLRQVRQLNRDIHVLLLANQEDEALLYEALRAGAGGYILKDIAPDELAQTVRGVARGDILIQPQLAARLLTRTGSAERGGSNMAESLTAREREVLQLLARGLRNKEIAARLFVSERTVNFHLANIYAKLHVSGRTEALSKALEQGLLKV